MLPFRKVLQGIVETFVDDPSFRNRVLGAALALVLVVGAFASGLELRISVGRSSSPVAAPGAPAGTGSPDGSVREPDGPAVEDGRVREPHVPGGDDGMTGLVRGGERPAPVGFGDQAATDSEAGPSTGFDAPDAPDPTVPPTPPPTWEDGYGDEEIRCVVTDTLVLEEVEDVDLGPAEEACEEATGTVDGLRHGAPLSTAEHATALLLFAWWS